jgi:hypothetical protein
VLDLKVAPPSVKYCQVSPSFKPSTVIVLLLVMPSLSDDNGDDADDDGDNKLSFTFKDTGLSDSDGITNNNTITGYDSYI